MGLSLPLRYNQPVVTIAQATTSNSEQGLPRKLRWTVKAYESLAQTGCFANKRVELIDGEILEMAPMNEPHAIAIGKCDRAVRKVFDENVWVRIQMPLK